jgi:hemoglobin
MNLSSSLYDKLGGFSAVRKLVSDFYNRVLAEEDLAPFFKDTNMADLIDHQTKFWTTLLGGPASYTGEQLRKIHTSMGIQDHHFDLVIDLVVETLEDHDLDEQHIGDISAQLKEYRSSIVIEQDADE